MNSLPLSILNFIILFLKDENRRPCSNCLKSQKKGMNISFWFTLNCSLLTYCPLYPLACGAATQFLHLCLLCAIFFKHPQVCWKFVISDVTMRRHVIPGRHLRLFPSGVQSIAVFVFQGSYAECGQSVSSFSC